MSYELDEDALYYFLCPTSDSYHTLFFGWLREDLIMAFQEVGEDGQAFIKIKIGVHTFVNFIDKPLFLVNMQKDGIFEFAGDENRLSVFKGMKNPPNIGIEPDIRFPNYFKKGIEPLLDLKLGPEFCINDNGVWVPLEV